MGLAGSGLAVSENGRIVVVGEGSEDGSSEVFVAMLLVGTSDYGVGEVETGAVDVEGGGGSCRDGRVLGESWEEGGKGGGVGFFGFCMGEGTDSNGYAHCASHCSYWKGV